MQKELFKAYRDNKATKRETDGAELPDWGVFAPHVGLLLYGSAYADLVKEVADGG